MKLFNTLTRQLENFTAKGPIVSIYTCGPTVYDYVHLGNLASYIYWDLLVRALKCHGYQIHRVLNLTDVGHLSSDSDHGSDKLQLQAEKSQRTVWEIADHYSHYFLEKFTELDLLPPEKISRATDYIRENIEIIELLSQKGYTYIIDDGIYYDTSKFPDYPKLAKLNLDQLKAGARVDFNPQKKHPSDFALWKFVLPGQNHDMQWEYLDRPGYPGWHLECSSIIRSEIGPTVDIHTGGIDHIPVHHTNEIAQSQAAFEQPLARFWVHSNFILFNHQKLSKSTGNLLLIEDLKRSGFSPLDFKLWVLEGHYQSERNFQIENLIAAKTRRLNWRNRIALCYQNPSQINHLSDFQQKLLEIIDQNLNSPLAFKFIDQNQLNLSDWKFVDQLFGLKLLESSPNLNKKLSPLLEKRQKARALKDFTKADSIREQINQAGADIIDTKSGPYWQYSF